MIRIIAIALTLFASSVHSEDTERLSYKAVSSALRLNYAKPSGHDAAHVRLVPIIKSQSPDVPPQEIVLTLRRDELRVQIPVKRDGSFTLPNDAKWHHDDTWIETDQPQGSLTLSLEGHLYLGNLTAVEDDGTCTLRLRQLFPSDAISENAGTEVATLFPDSKQTISLPVFETIQLRNEDSDSPQVWLLRESANSEVEMEEDTSFTVPREKSTKHPDGMIHLRPSAGWRWRAKPNGLPWTSWVDIAAERKKAEP